mmetsp:Transcript_3114/g.9519  ORF Transcript_3114/g.9519 Transcript_3114/m.9519 type:complete len:90 (+) Transcript_3114:2752-3021(+)
MSEALRSKHQDATVIADAASFRVKRLYVGYRNKSATAKVCIWRDSMIHAIIVLVLSKWVRVRASSGRVFWIDWFVETVNVLIASISTLL